MVNSTIVSPHRVRARPAGRVIFSELFMVPTAGGTDPSQEPFVGRETRSTGGSNPGNTRHTGTTPGPPRGQETGAGPFLESRKNGFCPVP